MSYVKPDQVVEAMIQAGTTKSQLTVAQMLLRGLLGGALLGCATTLAFTATAQTGIGMAGALLFPAGFVIIVLLGLELVTGNFALIPLAVMERETTVSRMLASWAWVFIGHLIGSVCYGLLYYAAVTQFGHVQKGGVIDLIRSAAEAKTVGYASLGWAGMGTVFIKAMLCNWMVCLGAVMANVSQSTGGKIAAMWLPIVIFFGQGFEHAVVNLFVIPTGMLMGADVKLGDWWLWNQIPVTLGNIAGGFLFTGLALYLTQKKPVVPPVVELNSSHKAS
ncbi:formate/nitrite transporter family protein [Paenibacillus ihbetae]|uniref:Formate transporter n=1 Tax=Paenibacillus ihbetae TaxID=1870820 RepID=A0ABX3K3F2_9BACL|nr:formate/nitrite transporter family protein [Paenibacillus ihbetae]OOC63960.1 formate transporter [Paenibacillus ihbetae]